MEAGRERQRARDRGKKTTHAQIQGDRERIIHLENKKKHLYFLDYIH